MANETIKIDGVEVGKILSQFREHLSLTWDLHLAKLTSAGMNRTEATRILSIHIDEF